MAELQAKGAVNFDVISDILWYHAGFKLGSDYELSASSSAGRCSSTRCARHVALPNVTSWLEALSRRRCSTRPAAACARRPSGTARAASRASFEPISWSTPPVAVRARPSGSPIRASARWPRRRCGSTSASTRSTQDSPGFCEGKALDERLAAGDDHSRAALLRAHLRDRGGSVGACDWRGLPNSAGRRPASGGFRLDLPLDSTASTASSASSRW